MLKAITALEMTPQNQWAPWKGIFVWFVTQGNSWCEFEQVVTNITRWCSVLLSRQTWNRIFPAAALIVDYYLTWFCISYYCNWSFEINKLFICIPANFLCLSLLGAKPWGEAEVVGAQLQLFLTQRVIMFGIPFSTCECSKWDKYGSGFFCTNIPASWLGWKRWNFHSSSFVLYSTRAHLHNKRS